MDANESVKQNRSNQNKTGSAGTPPANILD
jgi:hypothetical protein